MRKNRRVDDKPMKNWLTEWTNICGLLIGRFYFFHADRLVDIQNKSFDSQRKLTELRLDFNKIAFVSNGTWGGLRELTILSLRENYIQTLDERTFATASKLRELDLGQNRIESIHPAAFAGLPDLRNLYLDDNRLTYASPAFSNFLAPLRPLAELNLASNDLSWIPEDLFASLPELSALDLSGCSIRNISALAFRGLGQLRSLKLHDNLLAQVRRRFNCTFHQQDFIHSSLIHSNFISCLLGTDNFVGVPVSFGAVDTGPEQHRQGRSRSVCWSVQVEDSGNERRCSSLRFRSDGPDSQSGPSNPQGHQL